LKKAADATTCTPTTGTSIVCTLSDIPPAGGEVFPVYVQTDGLATPSTVNGHAIADAANAAATPAAPGRALGAVSVTPCGSDECLPGVAAPGTPMQSTDKDPTKVGDTKQIVIVPASVNLAPKGRVYGKPFTLPKRGHRIKVRPRLDTSPGARVSLATLAANTD